MKSCLFWGLVLSGGLYSSVFAEIVPISEQSGQNIVCSGPTFTYQHDVRQHGVDTNLAIWGDAGFVEETGTVYASFYTDSSKGGNPAVFQYSFIAESPAVFGDVSVASLARIFSNDCSVIGEYKIGDGSWIQFFSLTTSSLAQPIDVFEDVHDDHFSIRYTVNWINTPWSEHVQLFRSSSSAPGIPGNFAFTFTGLLVTDIDCDKADIAGDDQFVDVSDFAALAVDFGLTTYDLLGDIDEDGDSDLADLQWLAAKWLCDCYVLP